MALITAQRISALLIPLLRRTLVLPGTVLRPSGGEFAGDNGDTITVRVRQPRTANVQATPGADISANIDPVSEVGVDVTLRHLYDAARVTEQEMSMQIVDFGSQVTEPQVAAVAAGAEDEIATAMNTVVADHVDLTSSNIEAYILEAREVLSEADVPPGDRFAAVSPAGASLVLALDNFQDNVARTGDSSALRDAIIGRYLGFTFVESNALTGGGGDAAINFYHRSGWAFANMAPVAPQGVQSASVSSDGLGMRQIFQYDTSTLSNQSVVSTFAGASLVDVNRTFKVEDAP